LLTVSLNCSMLLLLQHLSGSRQPAVPWAQTSSPMSTCTRWPPYLRPAVLLNPRVYSQTPFNPTESQFLGRFLSPGVPQERRIWNSQGGRKEKGFVFSFPLHFWGLYNNRISSWSCKATKDVATLSMSSVCCSHVFWETNSQKDNADSVVQFITQAGSRQSLLLAKHPDQFLWKPYIPYVYKVPWN